MGFGTEAPKNGLRRHPSVSRHMLGEDTSQREDTWASEDTFSEHCPGQDTSDSGATFVSKDICRRQVGRRHVLLRRHTGVRRHVPKTGRAKKRVVAETHGCAKTLHEDRSGEGTCRCEMLRRRMGVRRHVAKTGQAKKRVVAKTHGCAKTNSKLPKQLEFPKSEPQTSIPRDKPPSLNMGIRLKKGSIISAWRKSYSRDGLFKSLSHWGFGVQGLG